MAQANHNQQQRLHKDINDCQTILNNMRPCWEISGAINPILDAKQRQLSFLQQALPECPVKKFPPGFQNVMNAQGQICKTVDDQFWSTNIPMFIAQYVDYLADPSQHCIYQVCIHFYEMGIAKVSNVYKDATPDQQNAFWNALLQNIGVLNDQKYKLDALPGDQSHAFSADVCQRLDNYFMNLQNNLEQHTGTAKGKQTMYWSDIDRLDQFNRLTTAWTSATGKALALSESPNDVAAFVAKVGQEHLTKFWNTFFMIFDGKAKVGCKENVQRIAQKITEIMQEENCGAPEAWKSLSDILRLQIQCESADEVVRVFQQKILPEGFRIQIVRLKPRFKSFLRDMIINFNWCSYAMCEMQIKLGTGKPSRGYGEQHFVYEVLRTAKARSVGDLAESLIHYKNSLAHQQRIFYYQPTTTRFDAQPATLQASLNAAGFDHSKFTQ